MSHLQNRPPSRLRRNMTKLALGADPVGRGAQEMETSAVSQLIDKASTGDSFICNKHGVPVVPWKLHGGL